MAEIERLFSPAQVNRVDIRLALGDLVIAAGGDQIVLRAHLRANDEAELETTVAGDVLTIKNRSTNGWSTRSASPIDLTLTVPAAAAIAVSAKTGLGDVAAAGVAGLREVQTGKGDVRLEGGHSPLTVKTGKGDVAVRAWQGDLEITTGKGDMVISDLAGGLQVTTGAGDTRIERWQTAAVGHHLVKTGAGDIAASQVQTPSLEASIGRGDCSLRQAAVQTLRVQCGVGDCTVAGDPLGGQWDVRSGKGNLTLTLATAAAARIEAATRHGNLHSNLPQVKVARPGPASQFGGRTILVVGEEPRAEIRLDTIKGDISVRADGLASAQVAAPEPRVVTPAASVIELPAPAAAPEPVSDPNTALNVLESLARGEISVDEAEMLLRSLDR
ncbi:MAG: DUF4097 family beta strand repeat protein [Anaerolinea sp.]|nr:DUF4097 family beta strand repeat protein [Anaerolinea sp.]